MAYLAKPEPVFLYNIGQCHRMLGHHAEAVVAYRNYLRDAPRADNRKEVEELIAGEEKAIQSTTTPAPTTTPTSTTTSTPTPTPTPTSTTTSTTTSTPATTESPIALTSPPRDSRRAAWIASGAALLAAGAASVIAGATLWSLDGRGTCDLAPPFEQCPEVLATRDTGIALVAAGLASAAGGATLTALGARRPHQLAIVPTIAPTRAALTLSVGF